MADDEYKDVRLKETLRVKIGEAKNLPASSFSGSARNTCCAIKIDSEEIYRTGTVEKSTHPFFAAEFQGEIPKKFRYLSFYMYEVGSKNKVLGKVCLKKEELYKYHQKEHWFPLTSQDGDSLAQGKVHVEVKLEECLTLSSETSHRLSVRVVECSDLTIINGSCNPYVVITMSYDKSQAKEVKRTSVRKKTICPQFDETFYFSIDKGNNHDKTSYVLEDFMAGELSISVLHDDSRVSREVLGNIFKGAFLGEIKISVKDIDFTRPHNAWYCLQAKEHNRICDQSLGSIRLRISYTANYVFPSKFYDGLRNLILKSGETKPFTSSAVFILGEIINHVESATRENAAKPLVKLFLHHGKLLPVINALACWEMSTTMDPNILFRGNSLLTKMVDELMKLIGLPYLHDTLKTFIDQVIKDPRSCEIDPCRLKEGEDLKANMASLYRYVQEVLSLIVGSGLVCPPTLRDVFCTLKSQALIKYPNNTAVRYQVVTSFIFLRFFTAAIMGPNLFDLYSDALEPCVQRTLTLISKGISGLLSLVSSKSNNMMTKEEYMTPLFEMFPLLIQTEIKMFLDIISSSSGAHVKVIEAPILLKEGYLIKRAQGRKRFGIINFKKRYFQLSNQSLSYYKNKGDKHVLYQIPITDILAVEKLQEESFKMKYMFQVIHGHRALYIQASNCVEEKEWLDILTKICKSNQHRLKFYHPAAYINSHWLCCKLTDPAMPGCTPVTSGLPVDDILEDFDSDREVEKIHSLLLSAIDLLDDLQGYGDEDVCNETCGSRVVYSGEAEFRSKGLGSNMEDPASCFSTVAEMQHCIITLEQEHLQYMHFLHSRTVVGSVDSPIGDGSSTDLVRNIHRTSERLSRRGSKSSTASSMSRQSCRDCRSRGSSFQERGKGNTAVVPGIEKPLNGDITFSTHGHRERAYSMDVDGTVDKDTSRLLIDADGSRKVSEATSNSICEALKHTCTCSSEYPGIELLPYRLRLEPAENLATNTDTANTAQDADTLNHSVGARKQSTSSDISKIASDVSDNMAPAVQDVANKDLGCTWDIGPGCTTDNRARCTWDIGPGCTTDNSARCTWDSGPGCTTDNRARCTWDSGPGCTTDNSARCTWDIGPGCTTDNSARCTWDSGPGCTTDNRARCTWDSGPGCTTDNRARCTSDADGPMVVHVPPATKNCRPSPPPPSLSVGAVGISHLKSVHRAHAESSPTLDSESSPTLYVESSPTFDYGSAIKCDVFSSKCDDGSAGRVDVVPSVAVDVQTVGRVDTDDPGTTICDVEIGDKKNLPEHHQSRLPQNNEDLKFHGVLSQPGRRLTSLDVLNQAREISPADADCDLSVTLPDHISHARFCQNLQLSASEQTANEANTSTVPERMMEAAEVQQVNSTGAHCDPTMTSSTKAGLMSQRMDVNSFSVACVSGQVHNQHSLTASVRGTDSVTQTFLETYQMDSTSFKPQMPKSHVVTNSHEFVPAAFSGEAMFAPGEIDVSQKTANHMVIFI